MKTTHYLAFGLLAALNLTSTPLMAASFKLEANGNEPLYQSSLSKEVFQYSRSNTLQDLTISNAAGEPLPYALIRYEELHPQAAVKHDTKPLIIYPIHENALGNPSELRVQLDKNTGSTTLNINASDASNKANTVYLLDAGKKHAPLQALSVDWQGSEGKLLALEVLSSDDLKNWSLAGRAVLLKTTNTNSSLLQNTISLDGATEARYLQIRPTEQAHVGAFKLTKANAEYSNMQAIAPQLLWQNVTFAARELDKKSGQINIDFESPGHYPASRLQIALPQDNTITQVTVLVRNVSSEPWVTLTNASLYRMAAQHGKTFNNPDVVLSPTVARYWRLQFNQSGGGIGAENPSLSLGWLPPTVVWNARGQAPFSLHVGEAPRIVNTVNIASLIPDFNIEKVQQLSKASLNAAVIADTDTAQNSWLLPIDYKRWLLWGGLFLGVLLLAGMAYSLLKKDQ